MAEPVSFLGEVLVELLHEGFTRLRPRAHLLLEHVRAAAEPPPGVSFQTDDGSSYTGLVLIDHNHVTCLFAARSEPARTHRHEPRDRPPLITPTSSSTHHHASSQRSFYDPDEVDDRDWDEPPGYGRFK